MLQQSLLCIKLIQHLTIMQPTSLKLHPQAILPPDFNLESLLKFPQLQKRINSKQFQISGIHSMISQLQQQAIDALKQQFVSNNNQVNLQQFVWLIGNCLSIQSKKSRNLYFCQKTPEEAYRSYELEYELVKVFEEIDIDHSNSISWEEYIEYITCSSLLEIQNNGNSKDDTQRPNIDYNKRKGKNTENLKQINYSHHQKTVFRKNPIRKIVQIEKQGLLGIVQKKSGNLTFINMDGSIPKKKFQLSEVDYNRVLSIDYSEQDRIFGILMNNRRVTFVEDGQMQKNHGQHKFSGDQIDIMYLKVHKIWLLVCLDQSLHLFKAPKGRGQIACDSNKILLSFVPHTLNESSGLYERGNAAANKKIFADMDTRNRKHETAIIGIKQLHNPMALCTASIQGQIRIWSLWQNQLLVQLQPCKQDENSSSKSLKGFEVFNKKSTSYLICWMFSTEISVWLPSSSLSKPYLGKLKGHAGIIQSAKFLTNYSMVISIDNKNCARLWHIKKLQCIQTWKLEGQCLYQINVLSCIPYVVFYNKIMAYYKVKCQESLLMVQQKMGMANAVQNIQQIKQKDEIQNYQQRSPNSSINKGNIKNNREQVTKPTNNLSDQLMKSTSSFLITHKSNSKHHGSKQNQKAAVSNQYQDNIIQRQIHRKTVKNKSLAGQASEAQKRLSKKVKNNNLLAIKKPQQRQQIISSQKIEQSSLLLHELIDTEQSAPIQFVKQILYDEYYDCILILSQENIKIVSVNNGNIVNKISSTRKNEYFVCMCLRKHRRLFVANNFGELMYYRVQDCVRLCSWKLFDDIQTNIVNKSKKTTQNKRNTSSIKKNKNSQKTHGSGKKNMEKSDNSHAEIQNYTIFGLDYNTHNDTLIVVAESQAESLLITIDSQLLKKKQISFQQKNLVSVVSSPSYNLFYIGSNDPSMVTIWDYHNISIMKCLQLSNPIKSMNVQNMKYNLLFIIQSRGIWILRVNGIEPRNNCKAISSDLSSIIKWHTYLETKDTVLNGCEFVKYKQADTKIKNRKGKVVFEQDKTVEEKVMAAPKSQQAQNYGIYIHTRSKLILANLNVLLTKMEQTSSVLQPSKSKKANIVKEFKFLECEPINLKQQLYEMSKQWDTHKPKQILDNYFVQSITNIKQKLCKIGCIKEILYFTTMANDQSMILSKNKDNTMDQESSGILNFYDYNQSKVVGKLSLPRGEIVSWDLCIQLSHKIIERLELSEKISEQIHGRYGKSNFTTNQDLQPNGNVANILSIMNQGNNQRLDYLRKAFILNKYFTVDDRPDLEKYIKQLQQGNKKKIHSVFIDKKSSQTQAMGIKAEELFTGKKMMLSEVLAQHQRKEQARNINNRKIRNRRANIVSRFQDDAPQQKKQQNKNELLRPSSRISVSPSQRNVPKEEVNRQRKNTRSKSNFSSVWEKSHIAVATQNNDRKYQQKLKQIQNKYSQAFEYIKNKKQKANQQKSNACSPIANQMQQTLQRSKSSYQKPTKSSSSSAYKIKTKNSASSAAKMFNSQIKVVNQCLNKISIVSGVQNPRSSFVGNSNVKHKQKLKL